MADVRASPARADRPGRPRRALLAALVVLIAGLAFTAAMTVVVRNAADDDARADFEENSTQTATAIEHKVDEYFAEMQTVGSYLVTEPDATNDQFAQFVRGSGMFDRLPSLTGIFYLERVDARDPAAFDRFLAHRRAVKPDFTIRDIGPLPTDLRSRYVLSYYVPNDMDLALPIGTDVTPILSVSQAIEEASQDGRGVVSSFQNDPLLQEIARVTEFPALTRLMAVDFFVGVPVYSSADHPPGTAPVGWIGTPVAHFGDVLAAATAGQSEGPGVRLTVALADIGSAERTDLTRVARQDNGVADPAQAPYQATRTFTVDGVPFRVETWSTADAADVPLTVPLLVVGGILGSFLAALVVGQGIRSRQRDRAFAAEMADRLRFQSDIVDSVATPMVVLDGSGDIVAANPAWEHLQVEVGDTRTVGAAARGPATNGSERNASSGDSVAATGSGPDGVVGDGDGVGAGDPVDGRVGRSYLDTLNPFLASGSEALREGVDRVLSGSAPSADAEVALDQDGRRRWWAVRVNPLGGQRGGAVVVHDDVTDRKRSHDELEFRASRDALTGVLSRSTIHEAVGVGLERLRDGGPGLSLLFIDLDDFKQINDCYGHATGDAVLRAVARRVQSAVRTDDRVGRLGGDEFLAVLLGVDNAETASVTAARILALLEEPIHVGDVATRIRASVGVATVDDPTELTSATLIDQADRAMYRAKQAGGNQFQHLG